MNESTSVLEEPPLDELSGDELVARAELLRAYEAVLRQRMRAELARRSALVRRLAAGLPRQRPRDG